MAATGIDEGCLNPIQPRSGESHFSAHFSAAPEHKGSEGWLGVVDLAEAQPGDFSSRSTPLKKNRDEML